MNISFNVKKLQTLTNIIEIFI